MVEKQTDSEIANIHQQNAESAAVQIGEQVWELDAGDLLEHPPYDANEPTILAEAVPVADAVPLAEAVVEPDTPPTPLQIIEALLFIGGEPLTDEKACNVIRGLHKEQFHDIIEMLNRVYRLRKRPYQILATSAGYRLSVLVRYQHLKERIFGGPREVRLTQAALDVLSLVAFRQPASKSEIDSIRGSDSGNTLRLLVRLGLITVTQRSEAQGKDVAYGTTSRFLDLFNLKTLEDLPQTGDPQRL